MSLADRLKKATTTSAAGSASADDVAAALGLSKKGIQHAVPRVSGAALFKPEAVERVLSGKRDAEPTEKPKTKKITNIEVASHSSEESDIEDDESEEDIPDDEGMDELLAEMNPMGDYDDNSDLDEAVAEMEEDLSGEDKEEVQEDEDEDDEDEAEEEKKTSGKSNTKADTAAGRDEQERRTIFITNVAVTTKKKKLNSIFKKFGKIESIRFRNISFARGGSKETKKRQWIQRDFHPERDSMNAYIRFETLAQAKAALEANCTEVNGKHIFVDMSMGSERDRSCCAFVGNLPANTEEEDLYEIFTSQIGPVEYIRVIRDPQFKIGKGFAYVKFMADKDLEKALDLQGKINYKDRFLRIQKAITNDRQLNQLKNKVAFFKRQREKRKPQELEAKFKKYRGQAKRRKLE